MILWNFFGKKVKHGRPQRREGVKKALAPPLKRKFFFNFYRSFSKLWCVQKRTF